jgi:hypothetical protein
MGPWFTVQKTGEWKTSEKFLISNGKKSLWATLELRLALD